MHDEVGALGTHPDIETCAEQVQGLVARLGDEVDNRTSERRRSRVLNQLGRNLERARRAMTGRCAATGSRRWRRHESGACASCTGSATAAGVERLRRRGALRGPETTMEADFATRFARRGRRPAVPTTEAELDAVPAVPIEQYAAGLCTASGGTAWHLENNLPMAIFALAYWSWMFAPVEGAFLHPFQIGPQDLFWPDFFAARANHVPGSACRAAQGETEARGPGQGRNGEPVVQLAPLSARRRRDGPRRHARGRSTCPARDRPRRPRRQAQRLPGPHRRLRARPLRVRRGQGAERSTAGASAPVDPGTARTRSAGARTALPAEASSALDVAAKATRSDKAVDR